MACFCDSILFCSIPSREIDCLNNAKQMITSVDEKNLYELQNRLITNEHGFLSFTVEFIIRPFNQAFLHLTFVVPISMLRIPKLTSSTKSSFAYLKMADCSGMILTKDFRCCGGIAY